MAEKRVSITDGTVRDVYRVAGPDSLLVQRDVLPMITNCVVCSATQNELSITPYGLLPVCYGKCMQYINNCDARLEDLPPLINFRIKRCKASVANGIGAR